MGEYKRGIKPLYTGAGDGTLVLLTRVKRQFRVLPSDFQSLAKALQPPLVRATRERRFLALVIPTKKRH